MQILHLQFDKGVSKCCNLLTHGDFNTCGVVFYAQIKTLSYFKETMIFLCIWHYVEGRGLFIIHGKVLRIHFEPARISGKSKSQP
jgi:hypothetical protein